TDFTGYPGGNGLPYAFLVGVDGKVIWQGRHGYEQVIAEEIKKVRYAGLGKTEVAPDLKKSAKLFSTRKYSRAIKEARKRLEVANAEGGDVSVIPDAEYIIERANRVGERMMDSAETAKADREYGRAIGTLKRILKQFKGLPIAEEAEVEVARLKQDREIKKQLRAEKNLVALMEAIKKAPTKEKQAAMLRAFAKKFDGMKAAEKALRSAENL
ncbi:MAG: hypothetical protein O6952_05665, partial [Planctomycetota bacterium]|nr:hypothetical protein [Planctomycetota bacterium]